MFVVSARTKKRSSIIIFIFRESGSSASGGVAATSAGVEQDVLDKLREFDIEEAAGPLAQHGFKKMRTLQKIEDRFGFLFFVSARINKRHHHQ
jgi:hypothetical protein